ncbi:M48 family metallopeptidase [Arthrobacter roseus]|uniref:M48 metallopeptidase family protein n=1 Tax=Arthrobacter roseus TaxID=136274 RepID=UPI00308444BC
MIGRLESKPVKPGKPDRRERDSELRRRALKLSGSYLPGAPEPVSVRWVSNQSTRWGSATPSRKTIRLSDQLKGMPSWVIDYVLLHELAHLLVPSHGKHFWDLLSVYPQLEQARAFLDGVSFAAGRGLSGQDLPESSGSEGLSPDSS